MATPQIQITGAEELIQYFVDLDASQVPFALASSLTQTAKDAQQEIETELPIRFTIRRLQWAQQGVRIEPATKANLKAVVKDIHAYMELQETGGDKIPYGQYICVPLEGARPTPSALISDQNKPAAVMARGGFIRDNGNGTGIMYMVSFNRRGKRIKGVGGMSQGSWTRGIVPMYALVKRATIVERYGFRDTVQQAVDMFWRLNFMTAWDQAVATKR